MALGGNKRLIASGLAGVVLALVIIASVDVMFWHRPPRVLLGVSAGGDELLRLEGPRGVSYSEPIRGAPKCIMNVTVYEFSKPLGPGSEADLVIALTSRLNYEEVFYVSAKSTSPAQGSAYYTEHFPGGIVLVDGGSEWSWAGSFEANGTKTLNYRIKAAGVGMAYLNVKVELNSSEGFYGIQWLKLIFTIVPDNVFVYADWLWPIPVKTVSLDQIHLGYDWSPLRGVGSEFNVSLSFYGNETNVAARLILPEGIALVDGERTWVGNLTSWDEKVRVSAKLKFVKAGTWFLYAYVEKDGILLHYPDVIKFVVSENDSRSYGIVGGGS